MKDTSVRERRFSYNINLYMERVDEDFFKFLELDRYYLEKRIDMSYRLPLLIILLVLFPQSSFCDDQNSLKMMEEIKYKSLVQNQKAKLELAKLKAKIKAGKTIKQLRDTSK